MDISTVSSFTPATVISQTAGTQAHQKTEQTEKPNSPGKQEPHTESTDTIKTRGLSAQQMEEIQEQQTLSFKQMLYGMLNTQAGMGMSAQDLTINQDLFSKLNITPTDSATAIQAISAEGEWGVDAVATRIMDMAVALSSGDTSKIELLKSAVEKGFEAAGVQWGGKMPSITDQTHEEINKRFDYWEENGTMDGYKTETEEE